MQVLESIAEVRAALGPMRQVGRRIGLVPTMGALHEGHLSLIRRARSTCDQTVISIFVNPLQFGPGEDYKRYPSDLERDLAISEREGVAVAFCPETGAMYPAPPQITVDPGRLGDVLCGASRPGHFRGVLTVVAKLFHILQPDRAYFGQKDAQQLVLVRRMVEELNFPIEIVAGPTVREPDGLALSSRNQYLSPEQRANATVLYQALKCAEALLYSGVFEAARLEEEMADMIRETPGAELDYARVVDASTLAPAGIIDPEGKRELLALVAVRFGATRLIDNLLLAPPEPRL